MYMKMRKSVLLVTALALVLSINITIAAKGGDPLAAVWAAIADLQQQIDNIHLIPGPQGEPGLNGQPGEQGPMGLQGSAGPSLKIVDANGDVVGHLIDRASTGISDDGAVVFDTNINKLIRYDYYTGQHYSTYVQNLSFTSTDCTGTPLFPNINNPYVIIGHQGTGLMYSPNDYSDIIPTSVTIRSELNDDLLCQPVNTGFSRAAKIYPVDMPSYVGPLSIVIQ